MNMLVKRLLTGTLAFATILTALPVTAVHASGNQYWTESAERVGYIEHVMNAYLAMLGLSCVGLGGMVYLKRRRKNRKAVT